MGSEKVRGDQEKQEKPRMERMERDDGVSGKMLCRKSGRLIPLICMICMICLLEIRHSGNSCMYIWYRVKRNVNYYMLLQQNTDNKTYLYGLTKNH